MAEEEKGSLTRPEFPTGRVKKIMKLDEDIHRVSSEALILVSRSTELFLQFLAEKSAEVAIEKKRKTVKLEHIRIAVKRHQPTSDFLLDSLPLPSQPVTRPAKDRGQSCLDADKPAPSGTRRIDHFFRKPEGLQLFSKKQTQSKSMLLKEKIKEIIVQDMLTPKKMLHL